jgi:ribosome-binding factor A
MHQTVSPVPLLAGATIAMSNRRIQRVSELVKQQVSEVVQELNLHDCGFITVTAAEVSPDLKEGRIFVSVIGSAEQMQRALATLTNDHGRIQRELAHRIILKYTPHLHFVLDETEAQAEHIEHLLDQLGDEPDS